MDNRSLSHSVSWMPVLFYIVKAMLFVRWRRTLRNRHTGGGCKTLIGAPGKSRGAERIRKGEKKKKSSVTCRRAERKWRTDEASLRLTSAVKTVVLCGWREEPVGNLFTGWVAAGVEVTGMRQQAHKGNRRVLPCNVKWKMQANIYASMKVRMCMAGAEEFVVVQKLT